MVWYLFGDGRSRAMLAASAVAAALSSPAPADIGIDASPHDLAKIDAVAVDLMAADSEPPAE